MGNYLKDTVIKGIKSTVLGLALFGIGCYMWLAKIDGTEINIYAASGLTLGGIVFILSPDTWLDVIKMIPSIIKNQFIKKDDGEAGEV